MTDEELAQYQLIIAQACQEFNEGSEFVAYSRMEAPTVTPEDAFRVHEQLRERVRNLGKRNHVREQLHYANTLHATSPPVEAHASITPPYVIHQGGERTEFQEDSIYISPFFIQEAEQRYRARFDVQDLRGPAYWLSLGFEVENEVVFDSDTAWEDAASHLENGGNDAP